MVRGAILRCSGRQFTRLVGLALSASLAFSACGKGSESSDRSDVDPALAAIEIDAATLSDADGVITVTVDATSPNTQIVRASSQSRITGTTLAFAPGSFDIDFDVSLEEGKSIATKANLTKLAGDAAAALSTAPAVVVTWTYDQDTFVPFKVTIPVPEAPTPMPAGASLVILTLKNQVGKPKRLLGLLPAKDATVDAGFVTSESTSYGAFQAVYINSTPSKVEQVETDDKQQGIGKISGVKPGAFGIVSTSELSGGSSPLSWDPSDLAESYTVKLDQASATCASPYFTGSVKSLSLSLTKAKDGASFACVTAVNAAGETPATNSGLKLTVDVSAPPVPGKPTTNGPVIQSIEPIFSWDAVTDVGPAGLAYYQLEIGTTPGGADVFNGPVTGTSKSVIGFDGKTYYARVSAVDGLGNASAFSPVSDGIEVDSD